MQKRSFGLHPGENLTQTGPETTENDSSPESEILNRGEFEKTGEIRT